MLTEKKKVTCSVLRHSTEDGVGLVVVVVVVGVILPYKPKNLVHDWPYAAAVSVTGSFVDSFGKATQLNWQYGAKDSEV